MQNLRHRTAMCSILTILTVAVGLLAAPDLGLAAQRTVVGELWSQDN